MRPPSFLQTAGWSDDRVGLIAWHAGWTVLVAAMLGFALVVGRVEATVAAGLGAMTAAGMFGLVLAWRDGWRERALALGGWSLAAVSASALSGGMGGPLVGMIFMPLAAGVALGSQRLAQTGALAVAVAALVGLISELLVGPGPPMPALTAIGVVVTAGAATLAVRLAWSQRDATLQTARDGAGRVESLLNQQPGLTLVLQPDGEVLGAYGAAPPALSVETLWNEGLLAGVQPADRAVVIAAVHRALGGSDAQMLFTPHGALDRRVSLFLRRQDVAGGEPRLIAQAFDGTPQFARLVELDAARAEAVAQNAGKSRFLANMSHELRTPLNAIIGFSDIMRTRLFGPLPDRYAEYAQSIHEAGGHLLELINDVLDMSKIEADRYELSPEPLDAREVVSAALALVRLSAEDKGVTLTGVLPDDPAPVEADRRALKQITLNLLSNAIKFTPEGGTVTVTLQAIGPYLELIVSDTGVGIAPDDLRRLGRPFEQAGGAEQRAQGTGLGLSLVRSLAELHGGRMSIDSALGKGSAVTVRLPVVSLTRPTVASSRAAAAPTLG